MNIIVEGLDRTGKSTLIENIQAAIYGKADLGTCSILRYCNIKPTYNTEIKHFLKEASIRHYYSGFELMLDNRGSSNTLIFDRFHIGEYVYSPIYREYEGEYVFNIEKKYLPFIPNTYLIVLIDAPENVLRRDDGKSLSTDIEKKQIERDRFIKGFEKSNIEHKILIDLNTTTFKSMTEKVLKELKL